MENRLVVCKISIDIDTVTQTVNSATEFKPWFNEFVENIKQIATELGYVVPNVEPAVSRINGGISKYYTFFYNTEEYKIKVVLGIRFSNHKSKITEDKHKNLIRKYNALDDYTPIEYIDTVQPSDVDYVHITIDHSTVRDKELALQILEQKLTSIRDKER